MRVLYDTTALLLSNAGVARYVRDLLPALREQPGLEVVTVASARAAPSGTAARVVHGVLREAAFYPFGLGRRARAGGADLVHLPASFPARRVGRPVVLTIHDALPWTHPQLFTRANALQQRHLVTGAARRAARVITSTEHAREQIVERLGLEPERVAITTWGLHPRFRPVEADRDRLRARFGIEGPYVLTVGTLEPRKNLGTALDAFARLAARRADVALVVVGGEGWRSGDVAARLGRASERTVATGFVGDDELVELYAGADCFLFPSLAEGFGMPPLEAMACGAPVVSSDRTSLPDVVGDAGLLVDPLDPEAMAEAVERVLGDPELAAGLRRRGLERAAGRTWERCAAETADVYRAALAAG